MENDKMKDTKFMNCFMLDVSFMSRMNIILVTMFSRANYTVLPLFLVGVLEF